MNQVRQVKVVFEDERQQALNGRILKEDMITSNGIPASSQPYQATLFVDRANNNTLPSRPVTNLDTETNKTYRSELFIDQIQNTSASFDRSSLCCICKRSIDLKNRTDIKFNNRFYHAECFTCAICHTNLNSSANNRFKINHSGNPMCSRCELTQAKTCYACQEVILSDELIIFERNNYHKHCFYCTQCGKVLINENNLREHESRPCCIQCFNEYFAIKCEQCAKPITTGESIKYNEKKYHPNCFLCVQCNKPIIDREFAVHNSKPCCLQCYNENLALRCEKCGQTIFNEEYVMHNEHNYHPDCFRCERCNKVISDRTFPVHNLKPYCLGCYSEYIAPTCTRCSKPITIREVLLFDEKYYHPHCFRCVQCDHIINDSKIYTHNYNPYCLQCYNTTITSHCTECLKPINEEESIIFDGNSYHADCFRCNQCYQVIKDSEIHKEKGKPCCIHCYDKYFQQQCSKCWRPITGRYTTYQGKTFHSYCFFCTKCHRIIEGSERFVNDKVMGLLCSNCA